MDHPAPFIVGVARSGTSLLRTMLGNHPLLDVSTETHFLPKVIRRWRELSQAGASLEARRDAVHEAITGHARFEEKNVSSEQLRERLELASDMHAAASAFYVVQAENFGKERWGDKTPVYLRKMRRIKRALPEAHFVHLIRDGRDIAISMLETEWGADRKIEDMAHRWVNDITEAREVAARLPENSYMEVRYEGLIREPRAELGRILEALGLPWDDAVVDYMDRARQMLSERRDLRRADDRVVISAEGRRQEHRLLAEPPREDRIERWRKGLDAKQVAEFEAIAGDMLADLGYP